MFITYTEIYTQTHTDRTIDTYIVCTHIKHRGTPRASDKQDEINENVATLNHLSVKYLIPK